MFCVCYYFHKQRVLIIDTFDFIFYSFFLYLLDLVYKSYRLIFYVKFLMVSICGIYIRRRFVSCLLFMIVCYYRPVVS